MQIVLSISHGRLVNLYPSSGLLRLRKSLVLKTLRSHNLLKATVCFKTKLVTVSYNTELVKLSQTDFDQNFKYSRLRQNVCEWRVRSECLRPIILCS